LIANIVEPNDYARLEFTLANAAVLIALLALGTTSSVPVVLFSTQGGASWRGIVTHQSTIIAILLAVSVAAFSMGIAVGMAAVTIFSLAWFSQSFWSVCRKSNGYVKSSLAIDSGLWLVILSAGAVYLLTGSFWNPLLILVFSYSVILSLFTFRALMRTGLSGIAEYLSTIRSSLPLMYAGFLSILAASSGRLLLGYAGTPQNLADYSAMYRVAMLPIVAHQLVMIYFFRNAYELPMKKLEGLLLFVVAAVSGVTVLFGLVLQDTAWLFGSAFRNAMLENKSAAFLVLAQCILWSSISLNDTVNAREHIASYVNKGGIAYFFIGIPLVLLLLTQINADIDLFVKVHVLVMLGFFSCQCFFMYRHGLRLARFWLTALLGFGIASSLAFVA